MSTVAFLSLYGLAFLLLAGYTARRTAPSQAPGALAPAALLGWLALGVALRLPLLWDGGFHYDTGTYRAWALTASDPADPLNLYKEGYFADYPPLYMYVLALLGSITRLLGWENSPHFTALVKLPSLLSDATTALLLLRLLREQLGHARGLALASLYWLNPAMIFTGALWGQTEALLCMLVLLGWLAWRADRLRTAAVVFAIALAFKPQGGLYAGIFGIAVALSSPWRRTAAAALAGIVTYVLIVLPFAWSRPPDWLFSLYLSTASTYDYITVNAYNLWALLGWNWKQDAGTAFGLSMQTWALIDAGIAILALAIWLGLRLRRSGGPRAGSVDITWAFVLATIAFFMLAPRMHERYILMLLPMLFLIEPARVRLPLVLAWTAAALANIGYVYYHYIDLDQIAPADTPFIRVSAAVNVAVSLVTVAYWQWPDWPQRLARYAPRWTLPPAIPDARLHTGARWTLRHSVLTAALMLAATAIGLYRLGSTNYPVSGVKSDGFSVEYRYERPVEARTALVYAGENTTKLRLERHDDGRWIEVIGESELKDFYKLHEIRLEQPRASSRYRWHAQGSGWRVNELGLLDAGGKPLVPDSLAEASLPPHEARRLVDEPSTWIAGRGYLANPYFDEIYHGRTGYEFLHRLPVYETTHPPLGKWIIAQSIDALGMTPFGWRFASVLASALTVGVLAWGGWLFNRRTAALLLAGGLGLFEFSRFTIGRYATIDSFVGVFILLSVLFLWRRFGLQARDDWRDGWRTSPDLLAAGASLGAAIAVKWSALYAGLGVFLFFAISIVSGWLRNRPAWRPTAARILGAALAFAVVPALIYYLSYIPFLRSLPDSPGLLSAEGFLQVLKSQRDIFDYHAKLTSTHPFSSPFWTWPLNLKPLWIFTGEGRPRTSITILGNPLIWWGSTLLVAAVLWQNLRQTAPDSLLLLGAWASLYLPWAVVDRATFNYHYYPAVLVLILLMTNAITRWGESARLRRLPDTALILAGALFAWFYPAISGVPAPDAWFESLRWLPTWWML